MNVPVDEVKEIMGEIGGRGMGYLFENMEKMDIQAERRNTQREKERADMEKELEKRMHVTGNKSLFEKGSKFQQGNQARLKVLTIFTGLAKTSCINHSRKEI